jgi:hypothetical protein
VQAAARDGDDHVHVTAAELRVDDLRREGEAVGRWFLLGRTELKVFGAQPGGYLAVRAGHREFAGHRLAR